jgi:hypothetical protein
LFVLQEISGHDAGGSSGIHHGMGLYHAAHCCGMISFVLAVLLTVFFQVYMRADDTPDNYWFRVLVREWVQFCIFMYIG